MDDLVTWLRAQLDEDERVALEALRGPRDQPWRPGPGGYDSVVQKGYYNESEMRDMTVAHTGPGGSDRTRYFIRWQPARVLAEVEAKRRIIALHTPEVRNVEWWDSPDHTGAAPVCPSCAVAEPNEWNLPVGQAGVKPDGWLSAYVLAPCPTLRALVLPYADQPGFKEEWRP